MLARPYNNRRAFTLIELLVVMSLILLIAGIGVAFLPTIGDSARQATAATMLQQWLLTAKQKALRDQVPCGLRLVPFLNPVTGHWDKVRECQFIEQPDDFPSSKTTTISVALPSGNNPATATISMRVSNQVKAGDFLEIQGIGLMHRINAVANSPTIPNASVLTLGSAPPYAVSNVSNYRIRRAPRVTGDDVLQFPDPVAIDLATNISYGNPLPINGDGIGSVDILFSPSGAVISSGVTTDTINLWVRDYNVHAGDPANMVAPPPADPTDGNQTIIAIYVRSGLTAAHPPAGPRDPYKFIRDGRASGK